MVLIHTADRGGKLLSFLRRELEMSSTLVKGLKWQGALRVNGETAHTDAVVRPGDVITVVLDEAAPDFPPEEGPLSIVYEDEALLALDKPAGVLMHPSFNRNTGTLANWVLGYYARPGQRSAVHPVSRLDRDTFGLVLLAKNAHVHARAMSAMAEGRVEKTYEALVLGAPPEREGVWTFPVGRCPGGSLLRQVDPQGQRAETRFRVLETGDGYSRLELHPITGRTHQLRVHCAHVGCPILGDPQYGGEAARVPGLVHQQLWAKSLELPHPMTGEGLRLESGMVPF